MASTALALDRPDSTFNRHASLLESRIRSRSAVIGVVALGYVGLPLSVEFGKAGYLVIGVDTDAAKVRAVWRGESYIRDVPASDVRALVLDAQRLQASTTYHVLRRADVIFICVPTPCTRNKEPDTQYIVEAARGIATHLRPGRLVVLRSTTYPGTTEELVRPILEGTGLKVGEDVFLAFAPERVDPGNQRFGFRDVPVVVGGCDPTSARLTEELFASIVDRVIRVSSPTAAEMAKLLENVFRNVNIALANQLALLSDRMGLDVWEIIRAAATKPFGFMPFWPGPGVGGHCIPVDPYYLVWKAREYDFHMDFIELAARVNDEMPYHVEKRILLALTDRRAGADARILVLGIAFKRDVADTRQSPALKIIELLRRKGFSVTYHDPLVPQHHLDGMTLQSVPLTAETIARADAVVILTDHTSIDYQWVVDHARLVLDTRNATAAVSRGRERITRL
jgi:UDP-N-acetyl-D-glucosamine dehydrogenase